MSAESEKDAQARWILKRDEPVCSCKPENPRHNEPWKCVTKDILVAWRQAMCLWRDDVMPLDKQKRLAYLWLHFSQDPEARRLSGRAEKHPGLDAWDDAAGMSELEKRMFE